MSVVQFLIAGLRHETGYSSSALLKIFLYIAFDQENLDVKVQMDKHIDNQLDQFK